MTGKLLIIGIILLNVFDCPVCLTTVSPRELSQRPDTLFSPNAVRKLRFRFRQPHNRVFVGYENESRNLRQTDKNISQTASTDVILLSRSGLFQNAVWRSKRHSDDILQEADDLKRRSVLKRGSKLSQESFAESNSESDLTHFGSLHESTKLDGKFLLAAFSNDTKKINKTTDKTMMALSRDFLKNPNADDTRLRTRFQSKTFGEREENHSGNFNTTENTPSLTIDPHSIVTSIKTKYVSSASPIFLRLTSTDNRINSISSSTSVTQNSKSNKTTQLPVVESSTRAELTSRQGKAISSLNTKPFVPNYQTISSTTKPLNTYTTRGLLKRTSGQPPSLSTAQVPTHIITTIDLMPNIIQNSITSLKTTRSKNIISTLRTSVADTSTKTMSTDVELAVSSSGGSTLRTKKSSPKQPTTIFNQKSTDYHRLTMITNPSQTPTTTKAITTTRPLSSATPKTPTMTSRITTATSVSSTSSSRSPMTVTTSAVTGTAENTTISNSTASTNTSTNSTLENETTTFLLHHTGSKHVIEEDDPNFWPIVLSLVIGIPAVIVFSIAMVVITKKRNIDSSTFFMGAPIGDEEV